MPFQPTVVRRTIHPLALINKIKVMRDSERHAQTRANTHSQAPTNTYAHMNTDAWSKNKVAVPQDTIFCGA